MVTPTLDQILEERCRVPAEMIAEARHVQAEKGGELGEILAQRKALSESEYLGALSQYYEIPVMLELSTDAVRTDYTQKVPIQFLKKHHMVPVWVAGEFSSPGPAASESPEVREISHPHRSVIAVNDPSLFQAFDDLCRLLEEEDVGMVLATQGAILSTINAAYDLSRDSAEQLVQDMEEDTDSIISQIEETADLLDDTSDAPIIRLVNHMLSQAVKARASDIHIEPYQARLKVRYRIDGILYDLITPPKRIQSALVSRVKVMASMNIAEKRLPQDGRIEIRIGDKNVDIRVSTIPTTFGERVVLRLLDKTSSLFALSDLGLSPDQHVTIDHLIRSPHGIILVTGPTGSGKTTTLYAILSTINTPDVNIITIEDPVEYQIQGIGQIQVNPKINLTFARGLRSIVRQDPDVILVGEIRDYETAEIAVQSSLTGHLVFSTLHTNDSASAVTRLIDIGIEPFLISSSLLAAIAQRLIRVLCPACKEAYEPDQLALAGTGLNYDDFRGHTLHRAVGCPACLQTGYRGRIGIFEIMLMEA
ncbi:GspE/PulE family protein, partial [Thermodesulfobacteriota bacterium]